MPGMLSGRIRIGQTSQWASMVRTVLRTARSPPTAATRVISRSTKSLAGKFSRWQSFRRKRAVSQRQPKASLYIDQRLSKRVNELVIVIGRWRDALGAARDGWIVDRLDVDAVLGEQRSLASLHFSGSAPGGEPRQRQLPRQIGSWPTSRSWFTSFVLLSLTASASFCRKRYSKRSGYSGSLRHTGARDAVILQCRACSVQGLHRAHLASP